MDLPLQSYIFQILILTCASALCTKEEQTLQMRMSNITHDYK